MAQATPGDGYWFVADRFQIESGEDAQTNPGRFGRQLALWLRQALAQDGYPQAEAVPEDWGWCVLCERAPVRLWVGCGNVDRQVGDEAPIVWHAFVVAEPRLLARLFKRQDVRQAKERLDATLRSLLAAEGLRLLAEDEIP